MSKKQNLVLVANDVGGPGGMETHLEEMIERLKHKYRLTVVASSLRLKDKTDVRYIHVPVLRRPFPLMILMFSLYTSLRLVPLRRHSIVHTTGAITLGRADVSTIHFCHAGWKKSVPEGERTRPGLLFQLNHAVSTHLKLWFERHCYTPGRTKRLVAVSRRVAQELSEMYPYPQSGISAISNGVDTERFHPATQSQKHQLRRTANLPENGTYAVFVGGDWERKGVRHLIEAYCQLAGNYASLHILIVGAGDALGFGRSVPAAFRDRVHFVGRQSNPETWYRMSDIFVFPSNYEACSLAVLEAAASGLAMVLTRVGGADDLVEHGTSGYFVKRSPGSIAERLRLLLEYPNELQRVASAVREQVEQLTWTATARQFEQLYELIASEKDGTSAVRADGVWRVEERMLK